MSTAAAAQLGFAGRIAKLVEKISYRLASTDEQRDEVFRLRYDGFRREQNIPANLSRRFSDPYDDLDNAWVFAVHVDGVIAATVRLHVLSAAQPYGAVAAVYPTIVQPWLDAGEVIVDPNRLVVDTAIARNYPELIYLTLRLAVLASEFFGADKTLATVRTEHQAFYRRMFAQSPVSEPGVFPGIASPIVLMATKFPEIRDALYRRYPFFQSTAAERQVLFGREVGALSKQPTQSPSEAELMAGPKVRVD